MHIGGNNACNKGDTMKKYPIHKDFSFYTHLYPPINRLTLPLMNAFLRILPKRKDADSTLSIKKIKITLPNKKIAAYLFEPKTSSENSPCLVYFHGGGFVLEAAPYHYALTKQYALQTPCKVLLVHYRLAPKHPFPIPAGDCFSAVEWLVENAQKFGIDPTRIAVGGDSAGGNLAASVCLMARDRNAAKLCGQMLVYPVIDRRMETTSMKKYADTPMWNSKLNKKMWRYYLKNHTDVSIEYASPQEAETLQNLPQTYMETAEFDCLKDEGENYAAALEKAGVAVTLLQTEGTMHGFDIVTKSPITQKSVAKRVEFLQKCFYPTEKGTENEI